MKNPHNNQDSKIQTLMKQKELVASRIKGEGLYVYRNNTNATLILPKPSNDGKTKIDEQEKFEGDNYFMYMVRNNSLRLVEEKTSPDAERKEQMINEEKLILDQPPTVTGKGVVEHVIESQKPKTQILDEENAEGEILLVEDPLSGVTILG